MNHLLEYELNKGTLDRRQRKTHLAVESALIELMQQKALEDITVSELARTADINRKTFYNNYSSIDDVFQAIEAKIVRFISDALPEQITIDNEIEIYHLFLSLASSLDSQKHILHQLFQNRSSLLLKSRLQKLILPYVKRNLLNYGINPAIIPYINQCVTNGVFGIFEEWFRNDGKDSLTPKQLALLAYNLTSSLIKLDNYKDL